MARTPKGAFYEIYRHCDTKKFVQNRDTPITQKILRQYELSETPKRPPSRIFFCDASFRHRFCHAPSMVYRNFCARQKGSVDFELFSARLLQYFYFVSPL